MIYPRSQLISGRTGIGIQEAWMEPEPGSYPFSKKKTKHRQIVRIYIAPTVYRAALGIIYLT